MPYQYGSDSLDISNPFKQEGYLYLISGTIISILGILSILQLRSTIVESGLGAGWLSLVVSLIILAVGLQFMAQGLIKVSRFFVGRGIPSSLANNLAKSEKHTKEKNTSYKSQDIEQMLVGRKNLLYQEPDTILERLLYSVFHDFIFLPVSMRNYLFILVKNTVYSTIAFCLYVFAMLSGTIGLTKLTETTFSNWLGILLCAYIVILWISSPINEKSVKQKDLIKVKNKNLVFLISTSILIPGVAELAIRQGLVIPEAPFNPFFALVTYFIIVGIVFTVGITLAKQRVKISAPDTEVSEDRDHWQENVHPKDYFRALNLELTNLRYKEIPNRVYRGLTPELTMEGSTDKGSFSGDTIQEIQPFEEAVEYPKGLRTLRFWTSVIGQIFVMLGMLSLFFFDISEFTFSGASTLFYVLFFSVVFWAGGRSLLTFAHLYWGEVQFKSFLIQFQGEGTYTESKISVGMAYDDSTQSENTLVRTSYTTSMWVSEVISTTQASSGSSALNGPRYILTLHKSDWLKDELLNKMRDFLNNKEQIAATDSLADGNSIRNINQLNKATSELKQSKTDEEEEIARIKYNEQIKQ